MPREGRIEGRVSADGQAYELVQLGSVCASYPIEEARRDLKLRAAVLRNKWAELP